jgi:Rad3-related DNA helicase
VVILIKVPFPDRSAAITQAREGDEEYTNYVAMQDIVQASGRAMRSEDDRCETFILDDQINWFRWAAKQHAPTWFKINDIKSVPRAPERVAA